MKLISQLFVLFLLFIGCVTFLSLMFWVLFKRNAPKYDDIKEKLLLYDMRKKAPKRKVI